MECILNNTLLDDVIDLLLKEKKNYYTVYQLININDLIRGEKIEGGKVIEFQPEVLEREST